MSQERTEPPSPRRLRHARQQGDVWCSVDLANVAGLVAVGLYLRLAGESLFWGLACVGRQVFDAIASGATGLGDTAAVCRTAAAETLLLCGPFLVLVPLLPLLVHFVQVRPLLALRAVLPQLARLSPGAGLKRVLLSARTYVEVLKSIIKVSAATAIVWHTLESRAAALACLPAAAPLDAAAWTLATLTGCAANLLLLFAALALPDVLWQRWQYLRRHRMSRDEVRREIEEDEGKAEHRGARKRLHQEIAESALLAATAEADVLLVNPTHLACALRFDPQRDRAPRLLAKGAGALARRLKDAARAANVPIVHDIPLARALFQLKVDTLIPEALYEAVKQVLLWVETVAARTGRAPAWLRQRDPGSESTQRGAPAGDNSSSLAESRRLEPPASPP